MNNFISVTLHHLYDFELLETLR